MTWPENSEKTNEVLNSYKDIQSKHINTRIYDFL